LGAALTLYPGILKIYLLKISLMKKQFAKYANSDRAALPDDLTDVEKAYLETLKDMQKKLKAADGKSG
jgi:hypothetical protein